MSRISKHLKRGRKRKADIDFLETFIQPRVKEVLTAVGLDNGLTYKEVEKLFLFYYKEYVLKNIAEANTFNLSLTNLGTIRPSVKKFKMFKNSKHCTEKYEDVTNKIITNFE